MGNLLGLASGATTLDLPFGGFTATPKSQYESRKIDFCGYHHPNYAAMLVREMGLFSKICNRS